MPVERSITYGRQFDTLFQNVGGVRDGFPEPIDLAKASDLSAYEAATVRDSMVFGTPAEVVA